MFDCFMLKLKLFGKETPNILLIPLWFEYDWNPTFPIPKGNPYLCVLIQAEHSCSLKGNQVRLCSNLELYPQLYAVKLTASNATGSIREGGQ